MMERDLGANVFNEPGYESYLIWAAGQSGYWRKLYEDDRAVLFGRAG